MYHLIAPSSMLEVARPQSAIVRERGRALIIQAEPQPPRYTIFIRPTAAVPVWLRELVFMGKVVVDGDYGARKTVLIDDDVIHLPEGMGKEI
jgi:hypothetical protein